MFHNTNTKCSISRVPIGTPYHVRFALYITTPQVSISRTPLAFHITTSQKSIKKPGTHAKSAVPGRIIAVPPGSNGRGRSSFYSERRARGFYLASFAFLPDKTELPSRISGRALSCRPLSLPGICATPLRVLIPYAVSFTWYFSTDF